MENVYFDEKERLEYEEWAKNGWKAELEALVGVVDGGFKISCSYDGNNRCYIVSLTAKKPIAKDLTNVVFLLRHSDLVKAYGMATYFFEVKTNMGATAPGEMVSENDW